MARIQNRDITLAIVGLGYVGLPLAVEFAKGGVRVVGLEVASNKVSALMARPQLHSRRALAQVADLVARGRLNATTDFAVLSECDAVSICVPTPLNKTRDPDMSYVIEFGAPGGRLLSPNFLIVLESTTYPGTTDEILPRPGGGGGWL